MASGRKGAAGAAPSGAADLSSGLLAAIVGGVRASNAVAARAPSRRALDRDARAVYDARAAKFYKGYIWSN